MTCLCLTKNRREWLPTAIRCFQEQTYPNRELLILADGQDVKDLVPADERIRLIALSESPEIGAKRNYGCERAAGELIAHWDDDDWSAPGRLADQVKRLLESGKSVTGYRTMRFRDPAGGWSTYRGTANFALGTSLLYTRAWWKAHQFRAMQIGEDNLFVHEAAAAIVVAEAGELMWASIHPGNTSAKNISGDNWT